MTECHVWPPDRVFDTSIDELRVVGAAIAKKKGEEQKFLAALHGAKIESRTVSSADLEEQVARAKAAGLPIEETKDGKKVS